jgi:phosphoribosylformylglycinamidine (FGAM) synthase-like enzyme
MFYIADFNKSPNNKENPNTQTSKKKSGLGKYLVGGTVSALAGAGLGAGSVTENSSFVRKGVNNDPIIKRLEDKSDVYQQARHNRINKINDAANKEIAAINKGRLPVAAPLTMVVDGERQRKIERLDTRFRKKIRNIENQLENRDKVVRAQFVKKGRIKRALAGAAIAGALGLGAIKAHNYLKERKKRQLY